MHSISNRNFEIHIFALLTLREKFQDVTLALKGCTLYVLIGWWVHASAERVLQVRCTQEITAGLGLAAVFFVPSSTLKRKFTWIIYFLGLLCPWSISLIMKLGLNNNPFISQILPLLCFLQTSTPWSSPHTLWVRARSFLLKKSS
jgi:hypothetical protein